MVIETATCLEHRFDLLSGALQIFVPECVLFSFLEIAFVPVSRLLAALALLVLSGCDLSENSSQRPDFHPQVRSNKQYFQDSTAESGVVFHHYPGEAEQFLLPEIMGSGCALWDYDCDGDMDLYVLNGHALLPVSAEQTSDEDHQKINRLFQQQADGKFIDVTEQSGLGDPGYSMGVAVGDINNDGYPDLYVTNYHEDQLYLNLQNGTFQNITIAAGIENPRWGTSACFFDYDRDGYLDLYVTNYVDYYHEKTCYTRRGQVDFCSPIAFPKTVDRLFHNLTGTQATHKEGAEEADAIVIPRFENVTVAANIATASGPGLGVISADFNGDTWPDLYVANDQHANFLWLNQQDGTFFDSALLTGTAYDAQGRPQASMGIAYGDVDRDGNFDLFLTHLQGETNALYLLDDSANFTESSLISGLGQSSLPMTGFGTRFADVDHDGDLDLIVLNGRIALPETDEQKVRASNASIQHSNNPFWQQFAEYNQIFINEGAGQFHEWKSDSDDFLAACDVSRGLACGDMDQDGDCDFVVSNTGGSVRIYHNEIEKNGTWLIVKAVEPQWGGRNALGAIVRVQAAGQQWQRLITTSSSYLSAGDPRAHFGLGQFKTYDRIEVLWPDGSSEVFPGGATNAYITVKHREGLSK